MTRTLLVGVTAAAFAAAGCGDEGVTIDAAPADVAPDERMADPLADPGGGPDGGGIDRGPTPAGPTRLHVRVVDARTRQPIPAMLALFRTGERAMLSFGVRIDPGTPSMGATLREVGSGGALGTWHGLALWRGEAVIPVGVDFEGRADKDRRIGFGTYRLVAHRGLEYDLTEVTVDLAQGRGDVFVEVPLARVVDTAGYFAADMHVHAAPSGDSQISPRDRVKTMVVAGVDVVVSSDHDHHTDLAEAIRELWLSAASPPPIAAVAGNEASSYGAHFGVFPVGIDRSRPRNGAPEAPRAPVRTQEFLDRMHAQPGAPLVQLNHARLNPEIAYFNNAQCGPWLDRRQIPPCSLDFEAMEVLSGYLVCGTKIREQVEDWYALLRFGVPIAATGNSDTHGTANLLGGFPRTYVRAPEDQVALFDQAAFVRAVRERRAIATSGPFLTLRVGGGAEEGALAAAPGGRVTVSIRMQAASWVLVDEVRLLANGAPVKTWTVPVVGGATPLFELTGEPLSLGADAFLTAEASGRKALPAFIVGEWTEAATDGRGNHVCPPLPGAEPGMAVFAVTNPVFLDVDGDGQYRGPQQPAVRPTPSR